MFGLSPRKAELRHPRRGARDRRTHHRGARLPARGANQAEFAELYRGHPFIHVPEVIGELMHRSGADPGARAGQILERCARRRTRSCATSGRRRSTASSMAPTTASRLQRRSAPRQLHLPRRRERELPGLRLRQAIRARADRDRLNAIACANAYARRAGRLGGQRGGRVLGDPRTPVTPEEVFAYWREPIGRCAGREQPFTITPEYVCQVDRADVTHRRAPRPTPSGT